jgi:hypothetical protein
LNLDLKRGRVQSGIEISDGKKCVGAGGRFEPVRLLLIEQLELAAKTVKRSYVGGDVNEKHCQKNQNHNHRGTILGTPAYLPGL